MCSTKNFTMDNLHYFIAEAHAGRSFPSDDGKQLYTYEMHGEKRMPTRWISLQDFQNEFEIIEIKLDPIDEICKENERNLVSIIFVCRPRL